MVTHKTKYLDFADIQEAINNITLEAGETVSFVCNKVLYIMYLDGNGNKVVRDITRGVTDFNGGLTGRGELFFATLSQAEFDNMLVKDPNVVYLIINGGGG